MHCTVPSSSFSNPMHEWFPSTLSSSAESMSCSESTVSISTSHSALSSETSLAKSVVNWFPDVSSLVLSVKVLFILFRLPPFIRLDESSWASNSEDVDSLFNVFLLFLFTLPLLRSPPNFRFAFTSCVSVSTFSISFLPLSLSSEPSPILSVK